MCLLISFALIAYPGTLTPSPSLPRILARQFSSFLRHSDDGDELHYRELFSFIHHTFEDLHVGGGGGKALVSVVLVVTLTLTLKCYAKGGPGIGL